MKGSSGKVEDRRAEGRTVRRKGKGWERYTDASRQEFGTRIHGGVFKGAADDAAMA